MQLRNLIARNTVLLWAAAIGTAVFVSAWPVVDAGDFEDDMAAEQREWMTAVQICYRAYGPSVQPEYNTQGVLMCVSRRGEILASVPSIKPTTAK